MCDGNRRGLCNTTLRRFSAAQLAGKFSDPRPINSSALLSGCVSARIRILAWLHCLHAHRRGPKWQQRYHERMRKWDSKRAQQLWVNRWRHFTLEPDLCRNRNSGKRLSSQERSSEHARSGQHQSEAVRYGGVGAQRISPGNDRLERRLLPAPHSQYPTERARMSLHRFPRLRCLQLRFDHRL